MNFTFILYIYCIICIYIYGEIKYIGFRDLVILRVEQRLRSILFVTGQLLSETLLVPIGYFQNLPAVNL